MRAVEVLRREVVILLTTDGHEVAARVDLLACGHRVMVGMSDAWRSGRRTARQCLLCERTERRLRGDRAGG